MDRPNLAIAFIASNLQLFPQIREIGGKMQRFFYGYLIIVQ